MALTATAQSAFRREPVWDEVIVPSLRKRLKDESNVLAKRISAASKSETDEFDLYQSSAYPRQQAASPTQYSHFQKPSAIPRPSLQQSRNATDSYEVYSMSAQPTFQRARTLSQPPLIEPTTPPHSPSAYIQLNRSTSPAVSGKGTRIPTSRGRAGSTSQVSANGSAASPETSKPNGDANPDMWTVDGGQRSYASRTTVRVPLGQASELFNEPAPFSANSSTSFHYEYDTVADRRASSESDEHPFEHWYRGDVSRNGGVGELRVGRREEMLDIANYGHTFRKGSSRAALSNYSRSRSNSRGRDGGRGLIGTRKRAGSVDPAYRDSIYLDEDDTLHSTRMVMDEHPPTDMESEEHEESYVEQNVLPHPNGTVSSPSLTLTGLPSPNPTTSRHQTSGVSRIPTPASLRQMSQTPPKPTRGASEPGSSSTADHSPTSRRRTQGQSPSQLSVPTAKRRAKSPAGTEPAASAPAAKKTRARSKPPSSMLKKSTRKEENRRSVGQYPATDGDDVVDAIPTWTQPIPPSGNWDDVVLPVVARKNGLQGHYERADGSQRPKRQVEAPYEPAPGTFGYDHSKYRPPRSDIRPEQISMDEFGQKTLRADGEEETIIVDEQPVPVPSPNKTSTSEYDRARARPSPPPSPAPFSHYARSGHDDRITPQLVKPPQQMTEVKELQDVEDGAGCCKCVIM